jgi:hypothetical protein
MRRKLRNFRGLRASRVGCALLLAFQFFFLNVLLPGHTRGAITLSGKSMVCSLGDLGCPFCDHASGPKKIPTRQDRSDCAICHLAMRITTETPVDFRLAEFGLLYVAPLPEMEPPSLGDFDSLPPARGPPSCLPA